MDNLVEHKHIGIETDKSHITIELKTPCGQENYRLPSCQLGALRTYLKILTCMNARNVVVMPEKDKERGCS